MTTTVKKAIHFYKSPTGGASSMDSSSRILHTCLGIGGRYQLLQPLPTLRSSRQNVSMTCVTKVWLPQCMSGWMTSLCHVLVINFHTLMEIPVKTVKINLKNISLLFDMGTYAYLLNCLFHIFEKGLFVFERSIFDNKVIILLQEWIQFLIRFTRKLWCLS